MVDRLMALAVALGEKPRIMPPVEVAVRVHDPELWVLPDQSGDVTIQPMRLSKAQIKNFRSVEDSGEFELEQVTSLVGKNEAGKTAILLALASLNPHASTPVKLDRERDYPRRFLTDYAKRHPDRHAEAVITKWDLEDSDAEALSLELGPYAARSREVTIIRRYESENLELSFDIDARSALNDLSDLEKLTPGERGPFAQARDTVEAIEQLAAIAEPSPTQKALLERLRRYGTIESQAIAILRSRLPAFMYFSTYDRMEGAVQIGQLEQMQSDGRLGQDAYRGHRLFQEFLSYAGVPLAEINAVSTFETFTARLQGASNNITDQILEYWTQNPDLSVTVTIDQSRPSDPPPFNEGTIARARVNNLLHRVDTPFSERSAGFVWFFSFLVKFAQVKQEKVPVVLLLDEPGLTLHGKAQGDLLRFFDDKLAPHHQIIYSTHSPFMVAADKLTSARIVDDQVEMKGTRRIPLGTKVRADVLSRDPDTLFPLQGALGYEITQTLFVGKHTLLVEGPSDILYLQALSAAAVRRGKTGLDSRWTLCPSGGIGNIRSFMALFAGNHIDVTVLADYAQGQKKLVEALRSSELLKAGRVFTLDQFTGKAEADVEDLFEAELFASILNGAYALMANDVATAAKLAAADTAAVRLVKQAEAYFRTVTPSSGATFDHFAPSAWLISHLEFLDGEIADRIATLNRASILFESLNVLLE